MNQSLIPQFNQKSIDQDTDLTDDNQRFLGFTIGNDLNALIPLLNLQAAIRISLSEILPIPQAHDSLLGIVNYGGKATWVIDLAHLMGGSYYALQTPERLTGMGLLFQFQNESIALLVQKVNTIETYHPHQCLALGDGMFTDRMKNFFTGYFLDSHQQPWVAIDLHKTIQSII